MATMWCGVGRCSDCSTDVRPDVHWSPAEASAAVAWHRHWSLAKKQLMTPIGKATPQERAPLRRRQLTKTISCRCVKQTPSGETARTGRQGCEGQRRRGKLRPGRDLHEAGPARLRERSHCFRDTKTCGLCFLHCCPPFQGKRSSQSLSARRSPQLVPVSSRGGVGSRCQPAHAIARPETATKHEPGLSPLYRVVSYGSTREVWALPLRLLSRYLRARGEAFAVVPLWRAARIRWISVVMSEAAAKAMFLAVLDGTSISDPEPVNCSRDPENWAYGRIPS